MEKKGLLKLKMHMRNFRFLVWYLFTITPPNGKLNESKQICEMSMLKSKLIMWKITFVRRPKRQMCRAKLSFYSCCLIFFQRLDNLFDVCKNVRQPCWNFKLLMCKVIFLVMRGLRNERMSNSRFRTLFHMWNTSFNMGKMHAKLKIFSCDSILF